ncbi:MAG: 23S rRNA (uracil(1939)-C(5))-methyltransferase RlmD, partial [candidate division WOR-3 bacterium]
GEIEEIIQPSPLRSTPRCEFFGQCGGCGLQHLRVEAQVSAKQSIVSECLRRTAGITELPVTLHGTDLSWRYRNKSQYHFAPTRWCLGYFAQKSHWVIDVRSCLLQPEPFDMLVSELRDRLRITSETPYSERTGLGNLRNVVIAGSTRTDEFVLVYVSASSNLAPGLLQGFGTIQGASLSIVQNRNSHLTNRILGEDFRVLNGPGHYHERLLDTELRISAGSFFQAHTPATECLLGRLLEILHPNGNDTLLDLFCGVGTFAVPLARHFRRVLGVDVNPRAVADARANAHANHCDNVLVFQAQAEDFVASAESVDAVIIDPPRRGCSPALLARVAQLNARVVAYVSCNPATLARDIVLLRSLGYEPDEIQGVDMFPQTTHVEVICALRHRQQ